MPVPRSGSIIQQIPVHSGAVTGNVIAVTGNQALFALRGFHLFCCSSAMAAGTIKVLCPHFTAKWPRLMTWILKAPTYAAGFSLSHPKHMLAGCHISDVAVCQ